jgi:hypothetical protein
MVHDLTPLNNYPYIRTRKVEELQEAIEQVYAKPTIKPLQSPQTLNATINWCQFRNLSIGYNFYGTSVRIEFPFVDKFIQHIPIRGKGEITSGEISSSVSETRSAVVSPDMGYTAHYEADCERFILVVDSQELKKVMAALIGEVVDDPLKMDLWADVGRPITQTYYKHVVHLARIVGNASQSLPDWWTVEMEQRLMTLFLFSHRHNYSRFFDSESARLTPRQVRRTEEYIDANWDRSVTLELLTEVAGVGALELFRTFKKYRGYFPFEYLMRARAKHRAEAADLGA